MSSRSMVAIAGFVLGLGLAAPLAGAADAVSVKGVTVAQAWARATPGGAKIGAAYLTIAADAATSDELLAASSDAAGRTELHTHIMEGDVMKMRAVDKVEIGKGATVLFQPSGYHVMLIDLKQPLKQGDKVKLTLKFKNAGDVAAVADVEPLGAKGPHGLDFQPNVDGSKPGNAAGAASGHDHGQHKH